MLLKQTLHKGQLKLSAESKPYTSKGLHLRDMQLRIKKAWNLKNIKEIRVLRL